MNGVKRYATKPKYVYAIQFTGENLRDVISFGGRNVIMVPGPNNDYTKPEHQVITGDGVKKLNVGDYVTKNDEGLYNAMSLEEFHALYNGVW